MASNINHSPSILGLDLGTSSIGWCLIENNNIKATGVRIFPEGMDRSRGEKSLNQDRRLARSIRRQGYRRKRRKIKLKFRLIDAGLLPNDATKLETLLNKTHPYELRARALDEKLEPYQIGRALYHLGQHRGYLSNRKTGNERDGKVAEGIGDLRQAISNGNFRTLGEYFYSLTPNEQRIRGCYTAREMYEQEFKQIWQIQEKFYPSLMGVNHQKLIYEAIFYQRPLKIQKHLVGECEFEPGRKRAAKATLAAQTFRLWSNINHLKILLSNGTERWLSDEERLKLFEAIKEKKQLSWEKVKGLLGLFESDRFNLERVRKSGMLGNQTIALIKPALGAKSWKALGERGQEQLISDLIYINEDRALQNCLRRHWQFDEETIEKLLKKSGELPKGYMHLSQKAMRNITIELKRMATQDNRGPTYDKACDNIGYEHTKPQEKNELKQLPFPGIPAKKRGEHIKSNITTEGLRNPMVERALFQIHKVVNAIIREYGKPDIIRVEMARDLKSNAKQRDDIKKQQRKNELTNEAAEKFLREEMGYQNPSRTDKLKYRLWQECEHVCPFSGNIISPHELFTEPLYEVEHIIPYSRSLDDSYMNKSLCHRNWNQSKGNQTPWEAFHGHEKEYAAILQRAKKLPYPKFKRFAADAIKDMAEFVSQQLNETRYISRKTIEYLQQLGVKIEPVKGGTTALLRRAWGLNNILSDDGEKTRLDHRHHAVDALVTALTSRSAVQKINTHSNTINGRPRIEDYPEPIPKIRQKAEQCIHAILVSHKPERKIKGALHKDFLYGLTKEPEKNVVIRKSFKDMKESDLQNIRDEKIRELAYTHLKKSKNYNDAFKNQENPFGMQTKSGKFRPINKARLLYNRSVTPIGKILPGSKDKRRNVWTHGNHHIELVEYKDEKGNKKWQGSVVTILEATLRNGSDGKIPVIQREHGEGKRFLATLHPNDMVKLVHKGKEKLCRVQKMDINENVVFREHADSNIKDHSQQIKFATNSLKETKLRILDIDPLGNILKEWSIQ